ncbi:MAG: hypothetical protein IJP96_09945 [Synergistaceae bacterium]|nr:hypothetical protein [Synergistaceae bacterium]
MAKLRDSNGRISIDEAEAEAEIKKLMQAKAKLEEASKFLEPSKLDSEHMNGETLNALKIVFSTLQKDFTQDENWCDTTSKYIRAVVNKYRMLDRQYAQKVRGGK